MKSTTCVKVSGLLGRIHGRVGPLLPKDMNKSRIAVFDFTENNAVIKKIDVADPIDFGRYVGDILAWNKAEIGIGRYNEDRAIYSGHGAGRPEETVHLGIDIFTKEETEVLCPLEGRVHSFVDGVGRCGPTIILEHKLDGVRFYTLYSHLSPNSITEHAEGALVRKGHAFCKTGNHIANGGWPSHLHFQVITDLEGRRGGFPAVCSSSQREKFLGLCPDPNLILNIGALKSTSEG